VQGHYVDVDINDWLHEKIIPVEVPVCE